MTQSRDYFANDDESDSPRRQATSPFSHRTLDQSFTGTYTDYTGTSRTETDAFWALVEAKESRGHPVAWLGRSTGNIGGKFVHTRLQVDNFGPRLQPYRTGATWREADCTWAASSGFLADVTPTALPPTYSQAQGFVTTAAPMLSSSEMDARGTTAIARVAPTNPLVDLSSSVAELLREGLPQSPGNAGNIGGEYLNVMFGYVPLYGDATAVASVARRHDELLRQYERDSGRWIRRRYAFPPVTSSQTEVREATAPASLGVGTSGLVSLGRRVTTKTTETKIWFSGAFTYHLPQSGWRRSVAELDHLYGVRPGIDTAWELTGYSWLVDYFSNVGDVMKNLTAFQQDGLVMPYGYVMAESHTVHEETWTGPMRFDTWVDTTITSKKTYVTHQRRLANPFGFGLEFDGLSGRQLSILAALGISRL